MGSALEGHRALRQLSLEHNVLLDEGCAAISRTLATNTLTSLSFAFSGASDATCEAIAQAMEQGSLLRELNLSGNLVGPKGVTALVEP